MWDFIVWLCSPYLKQIYIIETSMIGIFIFVPWIVTYDKMIDFEIVKDLNRNHATIKKKKMKILVKWEHENRFKNPRKNSLRNIKRR